MTKGNNNQQRDAKYFLYVIPPCKSQSAVKYHFALCCNMMAVPELHRRRRRKKKKQPSESYSAFQLRSKTISSRIKQRSSDNRSSLQLCVNMDSFVLHFVPFGLSGSSDVAATTIKKSRNRLRRHRWGKGCDLQMEFTKQI